MKTKKLILIFIIAIMSFSICTPMIASAKTNTKTHSVFGDVYGGYAKDSFVWETNNGKVISSSASQASKAIMLIYSVNRVKITRTAKTNSYHEYQSVYKINVINKTIQDIVKKILGVNISLGNKQITTTYRLNSDGTFKLVKVSY